MVFGVGTSGDKGQCGCSKRGCSAHTPLEGAYKAPLSLKLGETGGGKPCSLDSSFPVPCSPRFAADISTGPAGLHGFVPVSLFRHGAGLVVLTTLLFCSRAGEADPKQRACIGNKQGTL